jgi:hypothetical protein
MLNLDVPSRYISFDQLNSILALLVGTFPIDGVGIGLRCMDEAQVCPSGCVRHVGVLGHQPRNEGAGPYALAIRCTIVDLGHCCVSSIALGHCCVSSILKFHHLELDLGGLVGFVVLLLQLVRC